MKNKIKNYRKSVITKICQFYADTLLVKMQVALESGDIQYFDSIYNQSCLLDSYCVIFHDIYLN